MPKVDAESECRKCVPIFVADLCLCRKLRKTHGCVIKNNRHQKSAPTFGTKIWHPKIGTQKSAPKIGTQNRTRPPKNRQWLGVPFANKSAVFW